MYLERNHDVGSEKRFSVAGLRNPYCVAPGDTTMESAASGADHADGAPGDAQGARTLDSDLRADHVRAELALEAGKGVLSKPRKQENHGWLIRTSKHVLFSH